MPNEKNDFMMPIAGYYGPYQMTDEKWGEEYDHINDDVYQKIKELGINLIVRCDNDYTLHREAVLRNLKLAEKYGMDVYVTDSATRSVDADANMDDYFNELKAYKSFKGITIVDEPVTEEYGPGDCWEKGVMRMEDFQNQSRMVNASKEYHGYVNLFPMYDWLAKDNNADVQYRVYWEKCMEMLRPKVLSWDHYPFDLYKSHDITEINQVYFRNLATIRELSIKYNVPFWSYVQAGSSWSDNENTVLESKNDTPTRSQMLWNVNTALAYGAKGIQYFPIMQPYFFSYANDNSHDFERNGLIGANGVPTSWYPYAKHINELITIVDEVLMPATSEKILAIGKKAKTETKITEDRDDILVSVDAENGALIGVFKYEDKTAYYVVNYDMEKEEKSSISLHFNEEKSGRVFSREGEKSMSGKIYNFQLDAGDAVAVVIE